MVVVVVEGEQQVVRMLLQDLVAFTKLMAWLVIRELMEPLLDAQQCSTDPHARPHQLHPPHASLAAAVTEWASLSNRMALEVAAVTMAWR